MDREALDADLAAIHDHLAATAERPVERDAGRWLGEAEAVAADLARSDLPPDVVAERLATVARLLAEVDGTGDETADGHVDRARERVEAALARLD